MNTTNPQNDTKGANSSGSIIEKLRKALTKEGDFPARTQTVLKLKALVNNPNSTVDKIAELILTEISISTKILNLVNSAYYRGAKKITTISDAIMRVGMHSLSDLFSSMVLMQKFVPIAKRGGAFSENIKRSILTSLLTSALANRRESDAGNKELAYLAGSLYHLGFLLLAYYFPQVYEAAAQRALAKGQELNQSISELLGISQNQLTLSVLETLEIPEIYFETIKRSTADIEGDEKLTSSDGLAYYLRYSAILSDYICQSETKSQLETKMVGITTTSDFTLGELQEVVSMIGEEFTRHCEVIEMSFLQLPQFIYLDDGEQIPEDSNPEHQKFIKALSGIRRAAADNEPISSILLMALQILVNNLYFDRATLLLLNREQTAFDAKGTFGSPLPKSVRDITFKFQPTNNLLPNKAMATLKPQHLGDLLFDDVISAVAIPLNRGDKKLGVIYAEIKSKDDAGTTKINFEMGAAVNSLMIALEHAINHH